ncbi:MAG: hypothetical protein ACYCYN_12695, partial [Solirubrobacteraceae bacterium]
PDAVAPHAAAPHAAAPSDLATLLEQLRSELSRLTRERSAVARLGAELQREIDAAERRIAQYADDRGVPATLADMARSVDGLRRRLAVAERERQRALDTGLRERGRAEAEAHGRERAQRHAALLERLSPTVGDGDLFLAECVECWEMSASADDRERHPWRDPRLGGSFLASLDRVNIARRRVASTCALLACGRIHESAGAAVHELRTGSGPTAPQRRREDGATAWRCSVTEGAGAVRLHYWQLPDGSVELARVGYHDDVSM